LFHRGGDGLYTAGIIIVVVLTVLVVGYYASILIAPNNPLNPFPPAAPARAAGLALAATPTLPPTWTPTASASPTPTLTPTPHPTDTSTPTVAPTPTRTSTPTPTATATQQPTATPPPTPTPLPPDYRVKEMMAGSDCTWTGIFGIVWSATDQPLEGVQVHLWSAQGLDFVSAPTDVDGNYSIKVSDKPVAARWFAQVLENGVPRTPTIVFETSKGCQNGLQKFEIQWQRAQ